MIHKSIFKECLPDPKFNESLGDFYWHQLDLFADKTIFVDYQTNRRWNGAQIKRLAHKIGQFLIDKLDIKRGDCCAVLYSNNDYAQILSLGIIFSGGNICATWPGDPYNEHAHILSTVQPKVVFAEERLHKRMLDLRDELGLSYRICIMEENQHVGGEGGSRPVANGGGGNNNNNDKSNSNGNNDNSNGHTQQHQHLLEPAIGFYRQILNYEPQAGSSGSTGRFPVPVEPNDPAYLLFTSGSTGKQKAVIRSHKNSINVCHSLRTAPQLWDLNESSVLAGFQELDHGTGTFCSKLTLATGLKNIIMDGFDMDQLIACIQRHKVTDFCIGTAYLHNLMLAYCQASPSDRPDLSSVKNIISIGSPLHSHALKGEFMQLLPEVSVRQAYGMTECGFISIQAREGALKDTATVGYQLPTISLKIINHETGDELEGYDDDGCEGELCVRGPTVSPGYIRPPKVEEARFKRPDGFYRTNDICSISRDGRIRIRGRYSEFLVFTDGWKVLPSEIEQKLLEHPLIKEAAIIGVPHPNLPGCHTPRAYVVPKQASGGSGSGQRLTEQQVYDFVAADMSEPKHLKGGVRIMDGELPRISVGKVDKKALRQMDGY